MGGASSNPPIGRIAIEAFSYDPPVAYGVGYGPFAAFGEPTQPEGNRKVRRKLDAMKRRGRA